MKDPCVGFHQVQLFCLLVFTLQFFFCPFLEFSEAAAPFSAAVPPLSLIHSPLRRIPSHLSSLCLLRALNKQTSSGWLASPIYNSSQSNYKKDLCRTQEMHLSVPHRGGEKDKMAFLSFRRGAQLYVYVKQALKFTISNVSTCYYSFFLTHFLLSERLCVAPGHQCSCVTELHGVSPGTGPNHLWWQPLTTINES